MRTEMMTHGTVVRNLPQQDLLNELKVFITGTSKGDRQKTAAELTKTALLLLRKLPACRGAIFQFFCKVFDTAASNYIQNIEVGCLNCTLTTVITN